MREDEKKRKKKNLAYFWLLLDLDGPYGWEGKPPIKPTKGTLNTLLQTSKGQQREEKQGEEEHPASYVSTRTVWLVFHFIY